MFFLYGKLLYSPRMRLYPVFLSLRSCRVLVVGAGRVGMRKITSLCEAEAGDVLVLDPGLTPDGLARLNAIPAVSAYARRAEERDISGRQLVFATTDDAVENKRIAALCRAEHIWCNVADDPQAGSFHVPAKAVTGELTLAVSTGGVSPALAKRIRTEGATWLRETYGPLATVMGRLRPLVLAQDQDTEENSVLFRNVVQSRLGVLLRQGNRAEAAGLLRALLPVALQGHVEELLHGLF